MRERLAFFLPALLAGCSDELQGGTDPRVDHSESAVVICADGPTVEGIDVSGYQPDTNWAKVAGANRKFAFIKATEGTGYVNPYFESDWKAAKANGILRGAYHYFHPDTGAQAQADHFLSVMGPLGPDDLPAVLDFEHDDGVSDATAAQRAKAWLDIVEAATGKRPILYTYPSFWNAQIGSPGGFTDHPLWIANYGVDCPDVPGNWKKWPFWQYSSTGNVAGVQGDVDMNRWNGTLAELKAFAGGGGGAELSQVSGNDAVTLVDSAGDARVHLFATGAGGELLHGSSAHGKKAWSELEAIGEGAACGSAAAFAPKPLARGEVFAPGKDGDVRRTHQSEGAWTELESFGGEGLSRLSALSWPDGRLEVFALGDDGSIHHRVSEKGADEWSAWEAIGGDDLTTGASAILRGDGRAQLFATDGEGTAWHALSGDLPGEWQAWKAFEGKASSRPVPVRWPDGNLTVFARGEDGELVASHLADGGWKPLSAVAPGTRIVGEPSAIMNPGSVGTAGPEVVARDEDGRVLHLWWLGDGYSDWSQHFERTVASDPFIWVRADGTAEIFGIAGDGALWTSHHGASGWTDWEPIASVELDPCAGEEGASSGGVGSSGGNDDDGGFPVEPKSDGGEPSESGCSCKVGGGAEKTAPAWPWLASTAMLLAAARHRRRRVRRWVSWPMVSTLLLAGCAGSDPVGGAGSTGEAGAGGEAAGQGGGGAITSTTGAGGGTTGSGDACAAGLTCVTELPFSDERDTTQEGSKLLDFYACKPTADESGPEIIYRLDVASAGSLTVTVTDGEAVDIDVHVLTEIDGAACVARDDVSATAPVEPGTVYVIADTYVSGGAPQAGGYQLEITFAAQ